jgi:pteridine reductase
MNTNDGGSPNAASLDGKAVLVTGAAKRLGAGIATQLHDAGMSIAVHYRDSSEDAIALCEELNSKRANSASYHQCDLADTQSLAGLVDDVVRQHGGLHALVNNASSFYPTEFGATSEEAWDDLMASNAKAPFFLAQAAAPWLAASKGCIVNMVDTYGIRPLSHHPVYSAAKAALIMLTHALALELTPTVRVNGIAPGAVLAPVGLTPSQAPAIPANTPMARWGSSPEIADAVLYLVRDATFTTGAILPVDGGRLIAGF